MGAHKTTGAGPPTFIPDIVNQHYYNETNGDRYLSGGAISIDDWGIPLSNIRPDITTKILSPQKDTSTGVTNFPDLITGVPIGIAGGNISGTGNTNTIDHGVDSLISMLRSDFTGSGTGSIGELKTTNAGVGFGYFNLNNNTAAATVLSRIESSDSLVFGYVENASPSTVAQLKSMSGLTFGSLVDLINPVFCEITGEGLLFGHVEGGLGQGQITSDYGGSMTLGYVSGDNERAHIQNEANGSITVGSAFSDFKKSQINTYYHGSFTIGKTYAGNNTSDLGSSYFTGSGCFTSGYTKATTAISSTFARGNGCFVHTFNSSGTTSAIGNNCFQFGIGQNATNYSLQIGNAGLKLHGMSGVPTIPQNGDFFTNNNYTYIRSNNVNVKII